MNRTICLMLIAACLMCIHCGVYTFSGSTLPPHIKTVGIPLFEDRTAEFGIDQLITDIIIEEIRQDNTLKIVDPGNADALLTGIITNIRDEAGQYDTEENVTDFRVRISIQAKFEDLHQREVRWENTFSDFGIYDNVNTFRDDAIKEAVEKIAEDIINKTISDW